MRLALEEAARIAGGRLSRSGETVIGVGTDSRTIRPGELFVALRGDFFDGHDFVENALRAGAVGAMVEREVPSAGPLIVVRNCLAALEDLAGWVRDVIDPLIVGITGSVGKTSTKDLLSAVSSRKFSTVATERSMNAEIGVPLTLLRLTAKTELLVCEMGARGPGQIAKLCEYVRPQMGVVTNVDVTHYEMFGSRAAIARSKGELVEGLPEGGSAILNADDDTCAAMAARTRAEVLTFGIDSDAWLRAERIETDQAGRASFRMVRGAEAAWTSLLISGRHQVPNALAAAAAGLALGLSLEECAAGLDEATGSPWRMEVHTAGGVTFINDAYNAGPRSTAAALETAAEMTGERGRVIVVLGHMAELGEIEREEHLRAGELAGKVAARLVVVGERAAPIAEGASGAGLADVRMVPGPEEALEAAGDLGPGDVVLVKGSRVTGLERLSTRLAEGLEGDGE